MWTFPRRSERVWALLLPLFPPSCRPWYPRAKGRRRGWPRLRVALRATAR